MRTFLPLLTILTAMTLTAADTAHAKERFLVLFTAETDVWIARYQDSPALADVRPVMIHEMVGLTIT
jgi:hypothetical protein